MDDLALREGKADIFRLLTETAPPQYRVAARAFLGFLEHGGHSLGDPAGWRAYQKYLGRVHKSGRMKGRKYSAASYNHYIDAMVDRLKAALESRAGRVTVVQRYEIEKGLKQIRRKKKISSAVPEDKILSFDEIRRFIAGCPDKKISLIFETLAYSGLRISEALGILIADLGDQKDHYRVRILGKGNRERFLNLDRYLVDRAKACFCGNLYLFEAPSGRPYRREYVSMRIKRLGRKILAREISAHTLRHSWATYVLKKTGRIGAVQQQLGHASSSTTLNLYVHDSFNWRDQQEIFR